MEELFLIFLLNLGSNRYTATEPLHVSQTVATYAALSLQGLGEGAGAYPVCIKAKAGYRAGSYMSNFRLGVLLKGTSAAF